jgi:hypothetical protein
MRPLLRSSLVLAMSGALLLATTPTVAAATSRFTVTLTIRGHLAPDIGFDFTPFPSVGGIPFCVAAANPFDMPDPNTPTCESGRTYFSGLTVGRGQSVDYEITLYHPTWARALWSGTMTWDGRNHRLDYVVDFDLPATDGPVFERSAVSKSSPPPTTLPLLVLAWLAGLGVWSAAAHRRRPSVRP